MRHETAWGQTPPLYPDAPLEKRTARPFPRVTRWNLAFLDQVARQFERINNGGPMNSASIFDPSPSEKLQLVEDLWDDFAAAPDAVPVHDWQKQELVRRKANLLRNPASGLPWEEVKRKLRARYAR